MQSIALSVSRFVTIALSFMLSVTLARTLSLDAFGTFVSMQAIVILCSTFQAFGADQLHFAGKLPTPRFFARAFEASSINFLLASTVVLLLPNYDRSAKQTGVLLAIAVAGDIARLPALIVPQARGQLARRAWLELIYRGLPPAMVSIVATFWPSILALAATAAGLSLTLTVVTTRGPFYQQRRFHEESLYQDLRAGFPYALSGAVYSLYFQADQALMGPLAGNSQAALYRAAYIFLVAAIVLPVVINNETLRPKLFQLLAQERKYNEQRRIVKQFAIVNVVVGVFSSVALITLGPVLLRRLFTDPFQPAADLLLPLGLALVPHFLNSFAGNVLVAEGHLKPVLRCQFSLAALNISANILIIPVAGARGSAWITLVTELFGTALYARASRKTSRLLCRS